MRIREGELKKNWKSPNQGPTRWGKRAELPPWTCLQSRLNQCFISVPPDGKGLTHNRCSINIYWANK